MIVMNSTIVIPVIWAKNVEKEKLIGISGDNETTTPNKSERLEKVIKSLGVLARNDYTLIVVSVTDSPEMEENAENVIKKIIGKHHYGKNILLFSSSHTRKILAKMFAAGFEQFSDAINLENKSGARNAGLVLSNLLGSDLTIFLEDDKIIEDPAFLDKAEKFIGKELEGRSVFGKGGPCLRNDADYYLPISGEPRQSDVFWCKEAKLNEALKAFAGSKERITESPIIFGGNMAIAREMFMEIPFDPYCVTGEDIDYLINARMMGFAFFMDSQMTVRQIPPDIHSPKWLKIRKDIISFLFDRKKLQQSQKNQFLHPISTDEMSPYPGFFLGEDLNERIMNTSISLFQEYLEKGEQDSGVEATRNIKIATEYENILDNPAMEYFRFHRKWIKMMRWLNEEKDKFSDILEACSLYSLSMK